MTEEETTRRDLKDETGAVMVDDTRNKKYDDDGSGSESSSDEEDDDLILEGVIVRNPEVPSSSSDGSSSEEDDAQNPSEQPTTSTTTTSTTNFTTNNKHQKKRQNVGDTNGAGAQQSTTKKKRKSSNTTKEPDIFNVEFTFCDMNEKFFHGIKTLLHSTSSVYAPHSSALSDLMIANVSVGTVISTEGDVDHNVYGFASVLSMTNQDNQICIQSLKDLCLSKCPPQHVNEMETVLSGKTARPAGFFFHARMANLPLELVEVLHQQLIVDIDWAVENAEGGIEERKSLDFGAFVRLAPAYPGGKSSTSSTYKYFDDEILASHAEFVYSVMTDAVASDEPTQQCVSVIVLTKTGHRAAMKDLTKLVKGV